MLLLAYIAHTQCIRFSLLLQMSHIAWSVCLFVCVSVCMLVTQMYHIKTAEQIEMPLGEG